MHDTNLVLGGKDFTSRLIVGTGKYATNEIMRQAHEESGAEIVTGTRVTGIDVQRGRRHVLQFLSIGQNALRRALKEHTLRHRVDEMIAVMEQRFGRR